MNAVLRAIAVLGLLMSLTACNRDYIDGRVTDRRGEALPGVTVTVAGTTAQDLSDGLGRYRIATPAGAFTLVFSKSGYTSAQLKIEARHRGAAPDAKLWVLPMNAGVYDATPAAYRETTWALPKQHYLKDGSAAFGIELPAEVTESTNEPFLLTHRTPRYNAQLSRLVAEEARLAGIEAKSIEVWVEAGTMAVGLEPLDPTDSLLQHVQIGRALEPGIYGIHWGAMEGYTTLDNRVFLFRVPEPPESENTDDAAADGKEAEAAAAGEASGEDDSATEETPAKRDETPANESVPAAEPKPAPKPAAPSAQDILEPADETPAPQR